MKLYIKYLLSLVKNPWFYFCEFMAFLAILANAPLVAIAWGLGFPILGASLAFVRDKYKIRV